MSVSRRELLRGVSLGAGAVLLSPVVQQLQAEARGQTGRPKRFVFVLEGNGLNPDQVQPVGIPRQRDAQSRNSVSTLQDLPLAPHELPEALQPLAPFKDRLTIVQGLSGRVCGGGHSNNFGALGVYSSKKGPAGETIDAALAKALPGIFPHVGLGISDRPEHNIIYNCSAWGPGQALPTQCRPDLAYNALFGSVAGGDGQQAFQAKTNLLDFLVDDIKRLEGHLAGPERAKLQHYLHAFEAMRQRHSRLNEIEHTLREHAPVPTDKYTSRVETDRLDAHFDIAAAVLISGLSNVVTIASGAGDPYFSVKFTGLGIELGKHSIGHGGSYQGKTWSELAIMIRRFHMQLIARLAERLQSVPEGDGTMLDNTLIVYLSDAAEAHHSRCWEWPFVLLGNLGGTLRSGRYLCFPRYGNPGHRSIAALYCTLLHAAGAPREQFGLADPMLKDVDRPGPLGELLA
jgi:hypothetical protein